jgi:hypothetical protein
MTTPTSNDPGNDSGDNIQEQNQESGRPRDWRRRRRSERTSPKSKSGQSGRSRTVDSDEELSQPLITFFEPAIDLIATYSGPLILAGVIGLVTGIVVVTFISSMRLYGFIDIVIGAVLLGAVGSVLFSNVLSAFLSRTGRYGANTLILLGAFTGIIIVANVLSFENNSRIDVTATNQFSLGNRTKDVLSNLTEDVRATAFYKDEAVTDSTELVIRRNKVLNTLEEFDSRTSKFTYRVVDPDLKPEIVSKFFGARPANFVTEVVIVESMDSGQFDVLRRTVANYTQLEQDLVTSTLVATGSEKKVIYFLSGHGERDIDGGSSDGYASVRSGLEGDNYRVVELPWNVADVDVEVPIDAALLVIASPTSSLPEAHEIALDQFLEGVRPDGTPSREHGRMIFLAEPDTPISFRNFLADWGLIVRTGYIRDLDSSVPELPQTLRLRRFLATEDRDNPALEILSPKGVQLNDVSMPGAAAINLAPNESMLGVLPLAETSVDSYLISDPDRTVPIVNAGADSDPRGPFVPVAFAQSAGQAGSPPPTSQPDPSEISDLIVFGDSDFLSNSSYKQGDGSDLFLNSANFLVGDYSLVSIRPKVFSFREFNLDANEHKFVRFSSWLFLPGLMGMMAALVWWVRR